MMKRVLRHCLLLVLMLSTSGLLQAQTITSAASGNWSNAATWVGGVVPVSGNNVTIPFGHTVTLTSAVNTGTGILTVDGTLALAGFDMTAGALVGSGNIGSASGTPTLTVGSNNTNDIWGGVYSGTGARFTKVGTGTVFFSGSSPNTYTGATTINGGRVQIATANERLSNSTDVFVASGAIFDLGGRTETVGSLAGAGTVTSVFNGGVLIVSGAANTTFSGVIQNGSGTVALTKAGTGTLTLTGANTYTGATTISAGTLFIGSGGTTGSIAGASIVNNAALIFNRSNDLTYAGVISGTGTLTKQGTNRLTLSGNNTYSGSTTINGGTLSISNDGRLGTAPASATPGHLVFNGGTLEATATFTLNANRGISLATSSANGINVGTTFTLTYPGIIAGAGSLSKGSSGTLILSGANTYTGATSVNAGTLAAAHANALRSSASVTVTNSTLRSDVALTLPPLTLSGTGASAGKMNCNGFNSSTGQLRLNTSWQTAAGSWGSTTSGATNQNDTYFTGTTGVLNILGPMILEVVTTAPNQTVTLPLSGIVDVVVNWGDATTNTYTTDADVNKVYAAAGTYTITISGVLTQFGNGDNPDSGPGYANPDKITRVLNWGGTGLTSLFGAFHNTTNLVQVPSDFPANVVNVGWMFKNSNFNQPIGTWNMSNVQRMGHMFENNTAFNQDIGAWNVSNVWDMRFMFLGATAFNNGGSPSIGNWNTANLSRPRGMFSGCTSFDQNLGNWNTSSFFDLLDMFNGVTLSPCNYDATLIGWAAQTPDPIRSNSFNGGNSKYTAAGAAARATLSGAPSNWVFTDGGLIVPAGPASSTPTLPIYTALPTITHTTEGITGMGTPTGLPAGVTASWASNTITIIGTPTEAGTFNYSIPLTGFCSSVTATGSITVTVDLLPVRLLEFTAQVMGDKAILNWKTASEQNNAGFDIERSTDGRTWSKIGFVPGKINSSTVTPYSYTDLSALKNVSYYRLKQVDLDGRFSYSRIVRINNANVGEIVISPNPVTDLMNVEINQRYRNQKMYITVTDMNGMVLVSRIVTHGNSAISTSGWPKGLYVVTLHSEDEIMMTRKILKQ